MFRILLPLVILFPLQCFSQGKLAYSEFDIYIKDVSQLTKLFEADAQKLVAGNDDYFYNPFKHQLNFQIITENNHTVRGSIVYQNGVPGVIEAKWYSEDIKLVKGQFTKSKPDGEWLFFDESGQIIKSTQFVEEFKSPFLHENYKVMLQIIDGDTTVKEGNGPYSTYWPEGQLHSKGLLKNGLKTGEWQGFSEEGKLMYREQYQSGKLIEGESFDDNGNPFLYHTLSSNPLPIMGVDSYYKDIQEMLKYPVRARINKIEGTVYISFIVNHDGSLNNVKVVKGIGYGCDEEALFAVRNGPKLKPALLRGRYISFRAILPVGFNL